MSNGEPKRFELSWHDDFGYRVSAPGLIADGERLEVIEASAFDALKAELTEREDDDFMAAMRENAGQLDRAEAGLREALDLIEVVDRALERMIQSPANDAHWKGRIKEIRAVFSRHGRGVSE